jgi:hypothetical protein
VWTLYTLGCDQAEYDVDEDYDSFVILDFGALVDDSGDMQTVNGVSLSPGQVWDLATYYAGGYTACMNPSVPTYVAEAIGTNNSNTLDYNKGVKFADTVNSVAGWNNTYESHVATWGANDIESWIGTESPLPTPTQSYNWQSGYSATDGPSYVDYGSADECPSAGFGPDCGSTGWQQGDYYNFSYRFADAWAVPEIYSLNDAEQWYWVADYGAPDAGWIQPWGPLDTYDLEPSTYTSAQAWDALQYFYCPAGGCDNMYFSLEMHKTSTS